MSDLHAIDPRVEARDLLGPDHDPRLLVPAPPAVAEAPWFADDPVNGDRAGDDASVVTPLVGTGHTTWTELAASDDRVASYAAANWLGAFAPLPEPPASLSSTVRGLRSVAFFVVARARHEANGKIGLRWTRGGLGTPFFADDRQVRIDRHHLVTVTGDEARAEPLTTLRAAGEFVGITPGTPPGIDFHDPPELPDLDAPLGIDAEAMEFLDAWYGFGTIVLERLRAAAGTPGDTRVQLWPEHLDPAIELGDADAGTRASYGASPGDEDIDQPYLYVGPWSAQEGEFWSAPFGGAAMRWSDLSEQPDQVAAALEFFERGRALLG